MACGAEMTKHKNNKHQMKVHGMWAVHSHSSFDAEVSSTETRSEGGMSHKSNVKVHRLSAVRSHPNSMHIVSVQP